MNPIPITSDLLAVARRVVWFKSPEEALNDPARFLAHVMTYGSVEDIKTVRSVTEARDFREALEHASPGIFDKRSWAYWNLKCNRQPTPPMPERRFN